jgi:ACT domain-containing protein
MKTRTFFIYLLVLLLISFKANAQDWNTVNFGEKYKGQFKMKGKSAKMLTKHKVFVNNFEVKQAVIAKGSQTTSALQSGKRKSIYSTVGLVGVSKEAYQQMVNNLHNQFVEELKAIGLDITNGDDVLNLPYVKKQIAKGKKSTIAGNTGNTMGYQGKKKINSDRIIGYPNGTAAVKNDYSFVPQNVNRCINTNMIKSGIFYQKITDQGFNFLNVRYYVNFVSFNGSRGYKDIKIASVPVISVNVEVDYNGPKGAWQVFNYKKDIYSTNESWVKGMRKVKDNSADANFFGLASSFGYEVEADSEAYLAELESILTNLQKDIVKNLKTGINN